MANAEKLIPFIEKAEGLKETNILDDNGGWTNCGITYSLWKEYFGLNNLLRFKKMCKRDWIFIYKRAFWDKCLADEINSQSIANMIVDWTFNAGQFYPQRDTEEMINMVAKEIHIVHPIGVDGIFGKHTIEAINAEPENILYNDIKNRRIAFYESLNQPKFIKGWISRVNNLDKYNKSINK